MISKAALSPLAAKRSRAAAKKGAPKPATPSTQTLMTSGRRRLGLVALVFLASMIAVVARFAELAAEGAGREPERAHAPSPTPEAPGRAEIRDRNGLVLATDLQTYELYLDASALPFPWEREEAADKLVALFSDLDRDRLIERLSRGRTVLVKRPITPAMAQAAHELGLPGLYDRPRRDRIYPGGAAMAHIVGWTGVDQIGKAGLELGVEDRLSSADAEPATLSIDLRAQRAVRDILSQAQLRLGAKAAVGVVMDVETGEIRAMASLPDFDPLARPPAPQTRAEQEESPLFHRAVQGRYELGSVFKIFTWALALETNKAQLDEVFPPPQPLHLDGHVISDDHPFRDPISFRDAFARSSNIVAGALALRAGREAQARMFDALGLHDETGVEAIEARQIQPTWTPYWSDAATASAAYGHGVAATPLHLVSAVASVVNGGYPVRPTLLARPLEAESGARPIGAKRGPRALSPATSREMRRLMRYVVTDGTGKLADAPGYLVGGKTGTAEKPAEQGGYHDDRVLASFVGAFPMDAPLYAVLVMLDEPTDMSTGEPRRGAGVTAAPVVGEVVARVAPLLGVRPRFETSGFETSGFETPAFETSTVATSQMRARPTETTPSGDQ